MLDIVLCFLFIFILVYYLAINLQWYSYSFNRIITKHHKKMWHVYYFIIPITAYLILQIYSNGILFDLYLCLIIIPLFIIWYKKLDKKLVWTNRIKRLFAIIALCIITCEFIAYLSNLDDFIKKICLLLSLCIAFLISNVCEIMLFKIYAKSAKNKIKKLSNLKIIAITGSYGKTSIKNFITQILEKEFNVYATPRSVNTYKGLVADINTNLNNTHNIYIAEAGARNKGDIKEISMLLQQHYAIIGKIGQAHIEYFKDINNTIQTKFEILYSNRLISVFMQKDNNIPSNFPKNFEDNLKKILKYPPNINIIESNLEKTIFSMELDSVLVNFETSILGKFNIDNISVAILIAKNMGMNIQKIQKIVKQLTPIPHRLQKIQTNNKIILDDSFNGNLEGMSEAIRLSSIHNGRKIIVTPGLVEHNEESNISLAKQIDKVFDIAIITGELNANILNTHINMPQKIILKNKAELENILLSIGQQNDLVLFANDAPSYI